MQRVTWRQLGMLCAIGAVCLAVSCGDTKTLDESSLSTTREGLTQDESTPIGKKWLDLKTKGVDLGNPIDLQLQLPAGVAGDYQRYGGYVIVHTNDYGAVYMPTAFFSKWESLQAPLAPGEPALYGTIGAPTADYAAYPGYTAVSFAKGEITIDGMGDARVVYGDIANKFNSLRSQLGAPITDEAPTPGSPGDRYQQFQYGDVYKNAMGLSGWTTVWAAAAVLEPIRIAYAGLGGPAGPWGPAIEDSTEIVEDHDSNDMTPLVVRGHSGWFRAGSIHRNATTGVVHQISDSTISAAYCREGGPKGWLGWPIDTVRNSPGGKPFVDFQNGVIVQRPTPSSGLVGEAFGNLQFHLSEVATPEGCGTAPADMKITVNVTDGAGNKMVDNHIEGRIDDLSPRPFNKDLGTSVVATGTQSITASVKVEEHDAGLCQVPAKFNDHGTVQFTFNIDNYWGLTTSQQHFVSTIDTSWATFNLKSEHAYNERDFRGQKWWSFQNFSSTADLSRPLYDRTFADAESNLNLAEAVWHDLFYDIVFKGITSAGNCNGMSLESIYAQKGRSMAPDPIHQLYADTQDGRKLVPGYASLTETLNVKQAYQLDVDVVLWLADMFWSDLMSYPKAVFAQADWFDTHGDYPVIALWNDHTGGKGHVVRPYWFDTVARPCEHVGGSPDGCNRIYVADPNIPTANVAPTDPTACEADGAPMDVTTCARWNDRFIEVGYGDGADGFYYQGAGTIYEGGQTGGRGKMFYMPYQLFMDKPVTPFSLALGVAGAYQLFLGETAGTKQISDTQGHTMYIPSLGIPTEWSEFRPPAERVPNVAPLLLADTDGRAQGWVGKGTGATHTYDIQPRGGVTTGTPMKAMFTSGGLSSHFSIPATPAVVDRVTLHDINGPTKAISLALPSTGTAKPVTWTVSGGVKGRWMELSAMMMSPSYSIRIRAEDGGRKLLVTNTGPNTSAVVRYYDPDRGTGPVTLGTVIIGGSVGGVETTTTIEPGSAQCISDSACTSSQRCLAGACVPLTFNPAQLQPLAWYQASASTVSLTGTGVNQWQDSSGKGHHLTQAQTGNQPTYSATSWNGASPSVTFDGTNDFLEYPASGGTLLSSLAGNDRPFTALITWEPLDLDLDYDLMQWDNGGANGGNSLIELRTNAAGGDESRYRHRRGDGVTSIFNTSTPKFFLNRRTTGFVFNGTALSIYDGSTVHLNGSANNVGPLTLVRYRLGHGDNMPLKGRIAEVVIAPFALTQSEFQLYRTYAQGKWGGL